MSKSSIVIDLESETETPVKEPPSSCKYQPSTETTPICRATTRVNSLEDALALSPQYDAQFLPNIKNRFGAKERELQRQLEEEKLRSKIHAESREEWEGQLEERLRKHCQVVQKAFIDERRDVVVPLPEITDQMEMLISKAKRAHPETEVLCDAFNMTITRRDIASLDGLNWLNDQVKTTKKMSFNFSQ